jgi:hypothetical protein
MPLRLQQGIALFYAAVIAGWAIWRGWESDGEPGPLFLSLLGIAFACGLATNRRMPRRVLAAVCLFVALIAPFGVINPFAAMHFEAMGQTPPELSALLAWMIPFEIFLLGSAYLLDYGSKKAPRPK